MDRTTCIKNDYNGECDCKFATADVMRGCFVCEHECVNATKQEVAKLKNEVWRLESIVRKYRTAFSPFINMCRDVVAAGDEIKSVDKGGDAR